MTLAPPSSSTISHLPPVGARYADRPLYSGSVAPQGARASDSDATWADAREDLKAPCVPAGPALPSDAPPSSTWTPSVHGAPDLDAIRSIARVVFGVADLGGDELARVLARVEDRLARAGALTPMETTR